jgi:hypothetical protein
MEILASAIGRIFSIRVFSIRWFPALILLSWPAMACNCTGALSPCYEVASGSAVFTGRAISVSPAFLNRLNRSSQADAGHVGQFYDQLVSSVPAQNLQGLKETFRALVPALAPDSIRRLNEAKSRQELLRVFESVLDHGSYVTLELKTVFTKGGNDDDAGALAAGKLFGVWTPSFDCGVEFQTGETYLVYASMDEDTDTVETDMGTRRLSDASGPALSFLPADRPEGIRPSRRFCDFRFRGQGKPSGE